MRLVVDANVLLAVLIKNSATSVLLTSPLLELYAPEFILSELWKHLPLIVRKTHRSAEELVAGLLMVQERIVLLSDTVVTAEDHEASLASIDASDAPYVALALAIGATLWTNDAALKKQALVPTMTTAEIIFTLRNATGLNNRT